MENASNINLRKLLHQSDSIVAFLNSYLREKKEANYRYSLRLWSLKLGYNNPSYLSDVLKGRRKVNIDFIQNFVASENLTGLDEKYLLNLYFYNRDEQKYAHLLLENKSIKDYWLIQTNNELKLSPLDFLIQNTVNEGKSLSIKQISNRISSYISQEELLNRLHYLITEGYLIDNEGALEINDSKDGRKILINPRDLDDLIPILKTTHKNDRKDILANFLFLSLNETDHQKVKHILIDAIEKIVLLAEQSKNQPESSKRTTFLYSNLSQLGFTKKL